MSDEEYAQDQQEEASYLEYQSTYRRMWEEGYRAGVVVGRVEKMCRIYEQEPLGPILDLSKEELAAIRCPF